MKHSGACCYRTITSDGAVEVEDQPLLTQSWLFFNNNTSQSVFIPLILQQFCLLTNNMSYLCQKS